MMEKPELEPLAEVESPPEVESPYEMTISLNVFKHLGLKLYSNIPAVLSEIVANAYDADATEVNITIDNASQTIIISDNGSGMGLKEINDFFLKIGVDKREKQFKITPKFGRLVMGRKGIGKLSIFSIADDIEVYTSKTDDKGIKQVHAFLLKRSDIENKLKEENDNPDNKSNYKPTPLPTENIEIATGTKIELKNFKKTISHTTSFLKRRLARRFSILGDKYKFTVKIDGEEIGIDDRDYFDKIQFLWLIGDATDEYSARFLNIVQPVAKLNGKVEGTDFNIKGWIGTVKLPSDLKSDDDSNNNKISILARGKLGQEDILESFKEGRIFSEYVIGEIEADFLDDNDEEDVATSSRQKYDEEHPRYVALRKHIDGLLKKIGNEWTDLRNRELKKEAVVTAEKDVPALKDWFDELKENQKPVAEKMFATIQGLHLGTSDEANKKRKEFYKQGIYAFEKLSLQQKLNELDKITSADDFHLAQIFNDLSDIESSLYYDITQQRIQVIRKFNDLVDENAKETVLQRYLFDNLWLLHPSWERATKGSEIIEKKVKAEFGKIDVKLTEEEGRGRMDIKYRTY
ncbi:MAG: ATP-binding protein, partial [Planctomycetota bacterium]